MHRFLWIVLAVVLCFSCQDQANDEGFLSQPPYDKLTDSIQGSPRDADLYYKRGVILYQQENLAYAEKDLRKAWSLSPTEEYALGLTRILKEKNPDSAIVFLQEAIKKIPGSISLKISLARGYQQKNRLPEALAIAEETLSRNPGNLDAAELKYDLLTAMNKEKEALTALENAYAYAPSDVALSEKLAFAWAEAKNPKVLALADSLIKVDVSQKHAEPYFFKGVYYSNTGNYTEAIKQFDEAIRHDYLYLSSYINKGIVYYEQKKYDQALNTFRLAMRVDPTYADSFYWIGKTMEAKGDKAEAKLNYEKAYQLDKTMTEAREASERL